ncbi:phage tail tape measure protein [Moraxella caviae]|uniref:Phage tail tape measure protein n=1 Tax=Moraxella caviae TaxID=34060 RepID=A0A1T0A3C2_9GAMM|nr:phage tail tape measure protein [Moraxella caviae]OOR90243.1 phage tail tape measure protein [Moraxella caviae]STZ14533.1 Phage-related minor tail protein [Moraxella caviae]VEW12538.1 Phage-related minor tail protein [Moraxella caviae]
MSESRVSVTLDVNNLGDLQKLQKFFEQLEKASDDASDSLEDVKKSTDDLQQAAMKLSGAYRDASGKLREANGSFTTMEKLMARLKQTNDDVTQAAQRAVQAHEKIAKGGIANVWEKAKKAASEYHQKLDGAINKFDTFANKHKQALDGFRNAGLMAGATLAGMGYALHGATEKAMEYESAFAQVKKVVDFESPAGLADMRAELEKLSTQIPLTVTELAEIAAAGGQLGVAEGSLVSFTTMVANMATAFDMSADAAGDAMAKLANVWGKPIEEMGAFGDMINTVSNNTPAKASQIVEALGRVGGSAKAFGLTEQSAIALTSAMIGLGKAPEVAATGINSMLTTLSTLDTNNKGVKQSFKTLGLDVQEFANLVKKDGTAAIAQMLESLNKLPKDMQIEVATDIFGKNFGDDILALATAPDLMAKINELLADSVNYAGSMTAEAENVSSTTEGRLKMFQSSIDNLKASIGDAFLPVMGGLADALQPVIESVTAWAKENPTLVTTIAGIVGAVLGVVTVLGVLAAGAVAVIGGLATLSAMAGLVGAGIGAISLPVVAVVAAIAGLVAAGVWLYNNWDTVKEKAAEVWNNIPQYATAAWEWIKGVWNGVGEWFSGIWQSITASSDGVWESIKSAVSNAWESIKQAIKDKIDEIKQAFTDWLTTAPAPVQEMVDNILSIFSGIGVVWDGLKTGATAAWDGIKSGVSTAADFADKQWQSAKESLGSTWDSVSSSASTAWNNVKDSASTAFEDVKKSASDKLTSAKDDVTKAMQGVKDSIANSGIGEAFGKAWEVAKNVVSTAFNAIKSLATAGMGAIKAIFTAQITIFASIFNAGFNLIKNAFSTAFNVIKALVRGDMQGVKQAIQSGLQNAVQIAKTMVTNIANAFRELGGKLLQAGRDAVSGFIKGITGKMGEALAKARELASKVYSTVKSALDIRSPSRKMKELGKHTADGFAKGIKKGVPKAVKEAQKMAEDAKKAVLDGIASLERDIALFGNDNPLAALLYDKKAGKYGKEDTSKLEALTAQKYGLERNKTVLDEIDRVWQSIQTSQLSTLEILDWEIANTKKYADVSQEHLDNLREKLKIQGDLAVEMDIKKLKDEILLVGKNEIEQLKYKLANAKEYRDINNSLKEQLIESTRLKAFENKQSEAQLEIERKLFMLRNSHDPLAEKRWELSQSGLTDEQQQSLLNAEHNKQILDNFNKLQDSFKANSLFAMLNFNTANDLSGSGQAVATAITGWQQMQKQYDEQLKIIQDARQSGLDINADFNAQEIALQQAHENAKRDLVFAASQNVLGGMASFAKDAFGEQSKAYRAMFALQQGFAIAQAGIAISQAMSKGLEKGFPAGLSDFAMAASHGAKIISAIKAVTMPIGQAHDGIMSVPKSGTWNLEKGERVLPRHTAKNLDNTLAGIKGGGTKVIINNYSGEKADVQQQPNGDVMVTIGKMINNAVETKVNQRFIQARRQGGVLYGLG